MRDYLGEIYRLGQGEAWVSTTAIAERLNVSGPATVRMVRRLHDHGLVAHAPYKGVRFTPDGKKVALLNLRRHRLVERFLVDVMDFGWHEVHGQAEGFQRGITQEIEDRMDEMLGHPTACPHGEPIPSGDGVMPQVNDRPLTVMPPGTTGNISRVKTHESEKLKYLAEIGLVPGAEFQLVNRAPFNGPLRLKVGHREEIIGVELAAALWVLPLSKDA
jgi:DtxR family Mn-dependent transcriptional regulator